MEDLKTEKQTNIETNQNKCISLIFLLVEVETPLPGP